jgi:hypothetical protein
MYLSKYVLYIYLYLLRNYGCWSKVVNFFYVVLKTVFYLSSALSHIHPIIPLRYLKVWINPLELKKVFWLAERSWQTVRQEWRTVRQDSSGSASRTDHFSFIQSISSWAHRLMSVGGCPKPPIPLGWSSSISIHPHNTTRFSLCIYLGWSSSISLHPHNYYVIMFYFLYVFI